MKVLQEMVFLSEIALQAKIALRTAERLQSTHSNFDKVDVWCSIQSILVSAANVSKIIWPIKKQNMARGEKLQRILKVDKTNILSDRKFRNYFEHYDDEIENWFKNHPSVVYIDLVMNPSLQGYLASSCHRGYNTFNNTLIFRGELLDLSEVMKALEEILDKCKPYTPT